MPSIKEEFEERMDKLLAEMDKEVNDEMSKKHRNEPFEDSSWKDGFFCGVGVAIDLLQQWKFDYHNNAYTLVVRKEE